MPDSLGDRIARLRAALGLTQYELAERIAVSRVAISHIEMGLQTPSERTIALLAGVFDCEPHELVGGTPYPEAKAERLPAVVARYTVIDRELLLLERDLTWLDRLAHLPQRNDLARETLHAWLHRLGRSIDSQPGRRDIQRLTEAQREVQRRLTEMNAV